ncbi:MAG TPA: serine/threonine-protein kinase [Blastocatellia bacterium]|nr:serine/threonine-protein kinase [Blastocatellia bacterium]
MAERYGKWIKQKQLGGGGQAVTFLVVEEGAEEKGQFVLKRLLNPRRFDRARREIEACLKLSHPNVVRIVDYDLEAPKPYLVTEYCEDGHLSRMSLSGVELLDRLRIFALICRGVGYAHSKGVVHRDIKPENIFLRQNRSIPVVGDFGICFVTEEGERVTLIDEVAGSLWYAAPELENGRAEDVGPESDVYSLGKVLYWMMAGRIFSREKHREAAFDLTTGQRDSAVFLIYDLLDKTIVFDKSKRFTDADKLADAVDTVIRRIEMKAHAIDLNAPQPCNYCGIGAYEIIINPYTRDQYNLQQDQVSRFLHIQYADNDIQREAWLVFACDYCGNIQIFRPDKAKNRDIWKPKN